MSDEQDSWFQKAFNVDLGSLANKVKDEAAAVVNTVTSTVSSVAQTVGEVVNTEVNTVVSGVKAVANTVASVVGGPGASKPGGAPGKFPLSGSVGRGGKNAQPDVSAVQTALGIAADGQCGPQTIGAIEAFQRSLGQAKPDGRVDAGGATEVALASGAKPAPAASATPAPSSASGGLLDRLEQGASDLANKAKAVGGEVIDEAKSVEGAVVDEAKAVGGAVVNEAKTVGGAVLDEAKSIGGAVADDAKGLLAGAGSSSSGAPSPASDSMTSSIGSKISDFLGGSGVDFSQDVAIPAKTIPALNGKVKIVLALLLNISGKAVLDSKDTTKLDAKALGLKAGNWWSLAKADPELAKSNGLWTNFKPIKVDGPALIATTQADTAIGKLSITLTWIGIQKSLSNDALKFEPQVLQAVGSIEPAEHDLGDQEIEGVKFTGLKARAGGEVQVGPEWTKILADLLKDQLKDQFVKWSQQLSLSIGADVIIAGSFIIGGVATIAGAVYQVAFGFKLQDMTESYAGNLASMQAGFQAGMAGAASPGDRYGQQGYALGQKNLQKLIDRTQQQNPQTSAADVKTAVVAKAADATKEAIDSGVVQLSLKNGMWDGLLADGKLLFTAKDAATAFMACGLGDDPRMNDREAGSKQWQAYLKKYPTQSKL